MNGGLRSKTVGRDWMSTVIVGGSGRNEDWGERGPLRLVSSDGGREWFSIQVFATTAYSHPSLSRWRNFWRG